MDEGIINITIKCDKEYDEHEFIEENKILEKIKENKITNKIMVNYISQKYYFQYIQDEYPNLTLIKLNIKLFLNLI